MVRLTDVGDITALLWLIAEHKIDPIDAFPVPPLLRQAINDYLVDWPQQNAAQNWLKLTELGRQRIGLPPLRSAEQKGADWLRTMARRARMRF